MIEERDGGLYLRIRAIPGAGRSAVGGTRAGALVVRVAEPPEKGRANVAVERAVASALSLPRRDVVLESGDRSREKLLRIAGIDRAELEARLGPLVAPR